MKIDRETYKRAFESAEAALSTTNDSEWIKSSALMERAYFLGVLFALDAISDGDHSKGDWLRIFSKTLWKRDADDTFAGTQLGSLYSSLLKKSISAEESTIDQETLTKLIDALNSLDGNWRSASASAKEILEYLGRSIGPETASVSRELPDVLRALEERLRFLSLVQISHDIGNRIK